MNITAEKESMESMRGQRCRQKSCRRWSRMMRMGLPGHTGVIHSHAWFNALFIDHSFICFHIFKYFQFWYICFIFHRYFRKLDLLNRAKQGSAFDISVKMTRLRMMYSPWRHNCEVTKVRLQTDCYPGRKASLIQFACLRSLTAFLAALHAEMQTSCGHHKGTAASASASYTRTLSTTVYMRMNI